VTDSERRVIFAPATDSDDLETSFSFAANDGEFDSRPATISVSLIPTFPRIRIDHSICYGRDRYSILFLGETNRTYRVWASTNLLDWEVLSSAMQRHPAWFESYDSHGSLPARFYKVSAP